MARFATLFAHEPISLFFLLFFLFLGICAACPDNYEYCANEGGTCYFTGNVAYGSGSEYLFMDVDTEIECTNEAFGGDPAWGIWKECCSMFVNVTLCTIIPQTFDKTNVCCY